MSDQAIAAEDIKGSLKSCFFAFDSIQAIAKAIKAGEADYCSLAHAIDYIAGEHMEALDLLLQDEIL